MKMQRIYMLILAMLVWIATYSQEANVIVPSDSTAITEDTFSNGSLTPKVLTRLYNPYTWDPEFFPSLANQSLTVSPNFYNPNAVMPRLGNLGGYVTSTSLPGLMGIESGSLSYSFSSENFSFTPAVYINKYGYFGGLTTSLGVGGKMSFKINDRFSITAFGAYHHNSFAPNPAVMSNMMSSRFGGYTTWHINDRWSLNAGVQQVYNSAMNRWHTVPILMPTFKVNGKDAIGIDVGGLLYQIVDWNRSRNSSAPFKPIIDPPVRPQIVIPPRE